MVEINSAAASTAVDPFAADDAAFKEIATQRYMYNADKCKDVPLVGNLLNMLMMPPIERAGILQPWNAFLIRVTRPTKGTDRDKNLVDVAVDSEVLIPATFELTQFLEKAATSEKFVFEVFIKPKQKIDIGGGQSMWLYSLKAKPEPKARRGFGLAAVLAPPQLPGGTMAGSAGGGGGGATDNDAPW